MQGTSGELLISTIKENTEQFTPFYLSSWVTILNHANYHKYITERLNKCISEVRSPLDLVVLLWRQKAMYVETFVSAGRHHEVGPREPECRDVAPVFQEGVVLDHLA